MSTDASGAQEVVYKFLDAYLKERSLTDVMAVLAKHVHWVGTGREEQAAGRDAVEKVLKRDFAAVPKSLKYECSIVSEQKLSGGDMMILVSNRILKGSKYIDTRATFLCTYEDEGGWKLALIHGSVPREDLESGMYFPSDVDEKDQGVFAREIGTKTLDLLEKSIPGGIFGVYIEPGFPLYYINNRMLEHLGYKSRDEFIKCTGGLFINAIPKEDHEWVEKLINDLNDGIWEYEIRYRILKKDGTPIWVNDLGRQGKVGDGRVLCISVVRDITEEMEQNRRIEQEAARTAHEAKRYDELFQSVLCGIVQYRLNKNGSLTFVNANKEAIRILGYTQAEFWEKTDWNLPGLVIEEDRERVLAEISMLKRSGDKRSYEYRMRQKNGMPCWIVGSAEIIEDSDEHAVIQSVFLDINASKQTEKRNRILTEQIEASNEILRLALEHTTTCECYYYPQKGILRLPQRAQERYNAAAEYDNMPDSFADSKVEEAYREDFKDMLRSIDNDEKTASLEFKLFDSNLWCRATFSVLQYDDEGKSELVVGVFEDITRQKRMEQSLEEARSKDSLTGLYNKEFGVHLVQECLKNRKPGECYTMMLLDMDDFNVINEGEGAAFANAILQEVADILEAEAAGKGICVRLGGDEFMLLLRDCTKARASVVGPQIADQVRAIFIHPDQDVQISVSIGMCVTDVADEYFGLYRCAESTLKYAKEHTKGTAACYLDASNELGVMLAQIYTDEHPVNAIERVSAQREDDLVSFALELLGKSKNVDDAIYLLLSRIGKSLQLDRVSLINVNREFLIFRYSYQWTRNRCNLQLGQEYYVSQEEYISISQMYDDEGLCEHRLREGFNSIASCLHAGVWNYGEYAGTMCFEIDIENYKWTEKQRKLIKELAKIINSFLMQIKADTVSKAKTDFLSRMSHEIRTPMNAISGMTTIAKSVLDDKKKAMDCLEKIESANAYLLDLINDILDMSRIESGKLELSNEPIDVAEQMNMLEALLWPQAVEKNISLTFENGYEENRLLYGDILHVNQVLINIIGNAVKFTPAGGSVAVKVEEIQNASDDGVCLRFSVQDTGVGIAPADTKRIFNAFEQLDRNVETIHNGTGLGLAISSRLVQLMGGQLEVDSSPGEGSEFYFSLNFKYAPKNSISRHKTPKTSVTDFNGLKILVAEDNEVNQEIVKTILEMHGFETVCVDNGDEAVKAFMQSKTGWFDAILMDIRMPVMDGLEATRHIRTCGRRDARSIPIIALTANAFDEDSKRSIESGMNGHLSKPFRVEQLLDILAKCLKKISKR